MGKSAPFIPFTPPSKHLKRNDAVVKKEGKRMPQEKKNISWDKMKYKLIKNGERDKDGVGATVMRRRQG
jgi:hypothetical protein